MPAVYGNARCGKRITATHAPSFANAPDNAETIVAKNALDTTLDELQRVNAIRTRIHLAAKDVIDAKFSTYRARNGRDIGVEDESGEKCWIVPSDLISLLEGALEYDGVNLDLDAALRQVDWPDKNFQFSDSPGAHDPCYVIMPDGAMLDLNHHNTEGVDIARAKFIIEACNEKLQRLRDRA
jgi:hypothetical protein